jgi:GT2 family glycosyltransferase/glycosyltransferase involved in cell wall biosynthesis
MSMVREQTQIIVWSAALDQAALQVLAESAGISARCTALVVPKDGADKAKAFSAALASVSGQVILLEASYVDRLAPFEQQVAEAPEASFAITALGQEDADQATASGWWWPAENLASELLWLSDDACRLCQQSETASWTELARYWREQGHRLLVADAVQAGTAACLDAVSRQALSMLHGAVDLNQRPVWLHICHGWGGGIRRWIDDMAQGDDQRRHLLLASYSDGPERRAHGQWLQLIDLDCGECLAEWPLQAPIHATAIQHDGHAAVLEAVLEHYRVDALLVSSLIGHSLTALQTQRPTVFVAHDAWPACSAIHAFFGEPCPECPPQRLQRCLSDNPLSQLFADLPPDYWLALRQQTVQTLKQHEIPVLAPSQALLDRLIAIDPAWAELQGEVLPHAIHWPAEPLPEPPQRSRPRIVLLGRVQASKGQTLLLKALPALTEQADVWLIGCGTPALPDVLGRAHVHVLTQYQREQLPALLADIAPDLGLLLSTVPESFSYTLSELQAAAVPTLATALGAFADRIEHGEDGFLAPPNAEAIVAQVQQCLAQPAQLRAVRAALAARQIEAPEQMRQRYQHWLREPAQRLAGTRYSPQLLAQLSRFAAPLQVAQQSLEKTQQALLASQREVIRRGDWGAAMEAELKTAARRIESLDKELADRLAWVRDLQADLQQADKQREVLVDKQAETQQWALSVAKRNADLETMRLEHGYMINSYSWKITRPIRVVNRGLRKAVATLKHQAYRARLLVARTRLSLRTRGLAGTVQRIREYLAHKPGQQPVAALADEREAGVSLSRLAPLVFAECEQPLVSIVVPVYNQRHHTYACLASIARTCEGVDLEVIVVDDCSGDDTPEMIEQCTSGVTYLRNEPNQGFIGSCNRGASKARGQYLVLLNNDTEVCPGWLQAMLSTFDDFSDCAMVGAQLVYPDGSLQEAGGLVFANGNAWNYGRGGDPTAPEFSYAREVDYCSGACLMLSTELFNRLGGFDRHYLPAYYEDTDLAFRLRALGQRVIYQPAARVVHFEGVSNGTDEKGAGIKRYQAENRVKFEQRWAEALARQPMAPEQLPEGQFDAHRAANFRASGHVLIVDATTPTPDQDSGSLRMVNLIAIFQALGYRVSFLPANLGWESGYSEPLRARGVELLGGVSPDQVEHWLASHGPSLDAVMLSRHYVASEYLDRIKRHAPQARCLFDTVDLHYLRERRQAELADDASLAKIAEQTREAELGVARRCDKTLVVSTVEKAVLADEAPDLDVAVLSNIHKVYGCRQGFAERQGILFIGGYQHPPNIDAVVWFADEIFPRVREQLPDVEFHVVGSKATDQVRALGQRNGIVFHGFVEEVEPFLENCRLAVAPLRYGAGVKGKVNMSMAWGQPVVVTSPAAEGMFLRHAEDALVADAAAEFAAAVVAAYGDQALWERLSAGGLANVERYFSFDAARRAVQQILPREPA